MTTIAVPGTVPYEVHVGRGVLDGLVEQLGPDVTKVLKDLYEPRIVPRVQADTRLIKNVQRADQKRPKVCRKLYSLRLTARKRSRKPAERKVIQSDVDKKFQAAADLEQKLFSDLLAFLG